MWFHQLISESTIKIASTLPLWQCERKSREVIMKDLFTSLRKKAYLKLVECISSFRKHSLKAQILHLMGFSGSQLGLVLGLRLGLELGLVLALVLDSVHASTFSHKTKYLHLNNRTTLDKIVTGVQAQETSGSVRKFFFQSSSVRNF